MPHELEVFLRQMEDGLASEYKRILRRAIEDPGTAGDEGEENWAAFLRQWLPPTYEVVTRGRLLSVDGEASPQIDVIVLKPSYPPALKNKKVYLAGGVAAAFETKTTLKRAHLVEAITTAARVQEIAHPTSPRSTRTGSPYVEMHGPLLYGLLAHSHGWSAGTARQHVSNALAEGLDTAVHPRDVLDLVCVSDLGFWDATRMSYFGPYFTGWEHNKARDEFPLGYASCAVTGPVEDEHQGGPRIGFPDIPVAKLCAYLVGRLAWEDPSLRSVADYFRVAGLGGQASGPARAWALRDVFSEAVATKVENGAAELLAPWSPWSAWF